MKFSSSIFTLSFVSILAVSCTPVAQSTGANNNAGVFQDPNNPYAVPGVTTQGGNYAPAAQAPYQSIPSTPINPPASIPPFTPSAPAITSPVVSGGGSHTVVGGDTLWGLSQKYGVSVDAIRQANGLTNNTILPGQSLSIPN